jgi:hypothetical protein
MALMGLGVILSVIALWSSATQLDLFIRFFRGEAIGEAVLDESDNRQALIAWVELALGAVVALVFILWVHSARVALDRAGVQGLRYSTRWAWLGFVVPFVNIVRPYQVVTEIWRASGPAPVSSSSPLIQVWWGIALLSGLVSRVFVQQSRTLVTEQDFMNFARTSVAVDAAGVLTAILAYLVIREIDRRQEAWVARPSSVIPGAIPVSG